MSDVAAVVVRANRGVDEPLERAEIISQRIRSLLRRHGLQDEELLQFATGAGEPVTNAARALLSGAQADRRAVAALLHRLEDLLGDHVSTDDLAGTFERSVRLTTNTLGGVIAAFCGVFVLGGLIGGAGWLGAPTGLLAFLGVLILLASFEALHVAAVQVRRADLGALAKTHKRAVRLHKHLRDGDGIDRFLAGRQIVVIFTVFFVARLSSFPSLDHFPMTSLALPRFVTGIIRLGVPGALFVLWLGQLAPQFLATRMALRLMNSRIGWAASHLALALGATPLARPGFWLAAAVPGEPDRIPSSAQSRWEQAAIEVDGWGVVGIARRWTISRDHTLLDAQTTTAVARAGMTHLTDRTMLLTAAPRTLMVDCVATYPDHQPLQLAETELADQILARGEHRLHKVLAPAVGSFPPDSLLRLALRAEFSEPVCGDLVHIERPTRHVLLRVEADDLPVHMPPARLTTYAVGDGLTDVVQIGETLMLEPRLISPTSVAIEHLIEFPPVNALLHLEWDAKWG